MRLPGDLWCNQMLLLPWLEGDDDDNERFDHRRGYMRPVTASGQPLIRGNIVGDQHQHDISIIMIIIIMMMMMMMWR
jgi:hypothetical protein